MLGGKRIPLKPVFGIGIGQSDFQTIVWIPADPRDEHIGIKTGLFVIVIVGFVIVPNMPGALIGFKGVWFAFVIIQMHFTPVLHLIGVFVKSTY